MEDIRKESAWQCSLSIRQSIHKIISSVFPHVTTIQVTKRVDYRSEIKTKDKHLQPTDIDNNPSLDDFYELSNAKRIKIFYDALTLTRPQLKVIKKESSRDVCIMMAMIFHWVNSASPPVLIR